MKYTEGAGRLGLPDDFKFGIELEANNVKTTGKDSLYHGESAQFIQSKNWHMASSHEEMLVGEGGAELVSPILRDTESDWQDVADMCEQMKKYPGNKGDKVVADSACGLHVHFDSGCLTKDPNRMKNFLRLYAESEELLYKMCNEKGSPIRKHAIKRNMTGIHLLSSPFHKGFANPTGQKILKQIEDGTLRVSYKKMGRFKQFTKSLKIGNKRYSGLNLTNIGDPNKNTIEFRMANGSLDPEVIKQNVFLYASLINTAIRVTDNPEQYKGRLDNFLRTDVSEEEKANSFLNLIMDSPDDRRIYMERWESVKDAPIFQKTASKIFAKGRFTREQFKAIAVRTPADLVKSTFNDLKEFIARTNEKGEVSYER